MWQDDIVDIVRVLINDLESTPTYSDERLENIILISAFQIVSENTFSYEYTVSISGGTISPDPVDVNDKSFINLVSLKAACTIIEGEAKKYSLYSARISDGPSSIDMGPVAQNAAIRAKEACQRYNTAKILHQNGQLGHIILTPYTNENLLPTKDFS